MPDWRAMFKKYVDIVGEAEGIDFLYPSDWSAEEWDEIQEIRRELGYNV